MWWFRRQIRYVKSRKDRLPISEKKRIARGVKDFFDRRYELRYNVMKQTEEFRPRNGQPDGRLENSKAHHENSKAHYENSKAQNFHAEAQHNSWQW